MQFCLSSRVGAQSLSGMVDAGKYADLVLLLVDGAFGFEMETFEFLNILQVPPFCHTRRRRAPGRSAVLPDAAHAPDPRHEHRERADLPATFPYHHWEGCHLLRTCLCLASEEGSAEGRARLSRRCTAFQR